MAGLAVHTPRELATMVYSIYCRLSALMISVAPEEELNRPNEAVRIADEGVSWLQAGLEGQEPRYYTTHLSSSLKFEACSGMLH